MFLFIERERYVCMYIYIYIYTYIYIYIYTYVRERERERLFPCAAPSERVSHAAGRGAGARKEAGVGGHHPPIGNVVRQVSFTLVMNFILLGPALGRRRDVRTRTQAHAQSPPALVAASEDAASRHIYIYIYICIHIYTYIYIYIYIYA